MQDPKQNKIVIWCEAAILFFISFIVYARLGALDLYLIQDEIFHVLAGRSWAANGSLEIADGVYERASVFTILVGWLFRLFGESVGIARLPSMLAASLLVVALFLWTRWVAGRLAGWIAALLFCFAPGTLELSVFIRFYTLHGLLFWLGAVSTYVLVTRHASPRVMGVSAAVAVAVLSFGLALHFQMTTIIGLIGLALWAVVQLGPWWRSQLWKNRGLNWRLATLLALPLVTATMLIQTGLAADLVETYRRVAGWNIAREHAYRYYHDFLLTQYPTLWTLFPLAVLVVFVRKPKPGIFCVCIFGAAFVLHSFAGMKAERYLYYAMPFFFAIWGMVLAEAIPYARGLIAVIVERISPAGSELSFQARLGRSINWALGWAGLCALVLFLVASNEAFPRTYRFLSGYGSYMILHDYGWRAARDELRPLLESASVVLVTESMPALYYLGRYDFHVVRTKTREVDGGEEFDLDPRTGRPVISTGASVQLVLTCYPDGLFVSIGWFREEIELLQETLDRLGIHSEVVQLPTSNLRVLRWERQETPPSPACSSLTSPIFP